MFAAPGTRFQQVAYVTNDLDSAMERFRQEYGVPGFYSFSTADPAMAAPGGAELRVALAQVNGVEIELIEPTGQNATLYSEILPGGDTLAVRFHHTAIKVEGDSIADWNRHLASLDTTLHPVVVQGQLGDVMRYIYTDERAVLGHYVEHVWMAPALLAQLKTLIPHYPPAD